LSGLGAGEAFVEGGGGFEKWSLISKTSGGLLKGGRGLRHDMRYRQYVSVFIVVDICETQRQRLFLKRGLAKKTNVGRI
jgi:hypothetical protein